MNKMKIITRIILVAILYALPTIEVLAQQNQLNQSQQFRLASRIIRVAEPGQLADSVNVWGDVDATGRFLVPKGTTVIELLSYTGGMSTIRSGLADLDWSKMRVEVNIHELNSNGSSDVIANFKYRFEEPFPSEMWGFKLKNDHTMTVRVKRRPSFRDYLGVFASTIGAVASTVILLDRLNNL
jgi:hypothetical protein